MSDRAARTRSQPAGTVSPDSTSARRVSFTSPSPRGQSVGSTDLTPSAPETTRPRHRIVDALEAPDIAPAFAQHMRDVLEPGPWEVTTPSGFWWVPHRLRHEIEIVRAEDAVVCRSTFCLVEDITDQQGALSLVHYFNQRPFGGAMWLDLEARTINVTSSVHLAPQNWFVALAFESCVARLVSTCERLAPRLAERLDAAVAAVAHPTRGWRDQPDGFLESWDWVVGTPEAGTGLWWSASELARYRAGLGFMFAQGGQQQAADAVASWTYDPDAISAANLHTTTVVGDGEATATITVQETTHPDLGCGVEVLLSSSIRFDGSDDDGQPPREPAMAVAAANALNRMDAMACDTSICISGWTSWRGQLCASTFIAGETIRTLQTLAVPRVGDMLAVLVARCTDRIASLSAVFESTAMRDDWTVDAQPTWDGVEENAGFMSLLVDDDAVTSAVVAGVPSTS